MKKSIARQSNHRCEAQPSRHGRKFDREDLSIVQSIVDDVLQGSLLFNSEGEKFESLPRFDYNELVLGGLLGRGQFGIVHEIRQIKLIDNNEGSTEITEESSSGSLRRESLKKQNNKIQTRGFISTTCIREGKNARYAVKTINATAPPPVDGQEGISQKAHTLQAIVDLCNEAHFLSEVHHSNIIKIRALSHELYGSSSFIVLDRIYDILTHRVSIWKSKENRIKKFLDRLSCFKQPKADKTFLQRVVVMHGLCSAVQYLHSRRILHRDLKPENVGFDVRDDVKLFDFGLARELKECDRTPERDGNYSLTGMTGSFPYMAPEVFIGQPYNQKADVFSLSYILWHIMALEAPFSKLNENQIMNTAYDQDVRPLVHVKWPPIIKSVIELCWNKNPTLRLSANEAAQALHLGYFEEAGMNDDNLDRTARSCGSEVNSPSASAIALRLQVQPLTIHISS